VGDSINSQGINLGEDDGDGGYNGLRGRLFPGVGSSEDDERCFVKNPFRENDDDSEFSGVSCSLVNILWSTVTQYDLDGDNIIETSEDPEVNGDLKIFNSCLDDPSGAGCRRVDFNGDGFINQNDANLIGGAASGWSAIVGRVRLSESAGLRESDTILLSDLEVLLWQPSKNDSDLGIVNFCMNRDAVGGCTGVDFNKDEVVNIEDKDLFNGTRIYDINEDNIVDTFGVPAEEDASSLPTDESGEDGLPDNTPPSVVLGNPSGELQEGIATTTVSVFTDEVATCKYSEIPGTDYTTMNEFRYTNDIASSQEFGVENGRAYTFYVKCADSNDNVNVEDYIISFSVAPTGSDTTPPVILFSGPSGEVSASDVFLLLTTDEVSVCKYSLVSGENYSNMQSFANSTSTVSVQEVSAEAGIEYNYYVKCADVAATPNINDQDYRISFTTI